MNEPFPIGSGWFHLATVLLSVLVTLLFGVLGHDVRRMPAWVRRNARWLGLNAALVVTAATALMLAPTPPSTAHCVETHRIAGPLEMVLTCDSIEFVRNSRRPGHLSIDHSWSQSRPLQIMVASLLTLAERPSADEPLPDTNVLGADEDRVHVSSGWAPYVVLNFVLLVVALMLFRHLNAPETSAAAPAVAMLGVFVLFNDVVKGFVWSAHTQMWNVLMPLVAIVIAEAFVRRPDRPWRSMGAAGSLLGIGLLAYGSLVICAASAMIGLAVGLRLHRQRPTLAIAGKAALFLAGFVVPTAIWTRIVESHVTKLWRPEVEQYRQFIWIADRWHEGGAVAVWGQARGYFADYLTRLWEGMWPVLVVLAIALVVGLAKPQRLRAALKESTPMLVASGITMVMCLGFFACMGFYRNRLAFNAVVPVLVIASVLLTKVLRQLPEKERTVTMTLVALASLGYVISGLVRVSWPY